jgi:hypothetical protein
MTVIDNAEALDACAHDTVVIDRNGCAWQRERYADALSGLRLWCKATSMQTATSAQLVAAAPLTVVYPAVSEPTTPDVTRWGVAWGDHAVSLVDDFATRDEAEKEAADYPSLSAAVVRIEYTRMPVLAKAG